MSKRIFHHGLDAILPEDDDSLDRTAVVADGVENILWRWVRVLFTEAFNAEKTINQMS